MMREEVLLFGASLLPPFLPAIRTQVDMCCYSINVQKSGPILIADGAERQRRSPNKPPQSRFFSESNGAC